MKRKSTLEVIEFNGEWARMSIMKSAKYGEIFTTDIFLYHFHRLRNVFFKQA
jgi:hypothetical protein